MLSNGLVGLSGGLVCQGQNYADIQMGTGAIVIGLAAIIIGEVLMGRLIPFYWKLIAVVAGSVIYQIIRAVVLRLGFDSDNMKLLTAVIVVIAGCAGYGYKIQTENGVHGRRGRSNADDFQCEEDLQ